MLAKPHSEKVGSFGDCNFCLQQEVFSNSICTSSSHAVSSTGLLWREESYSYELVALAEYLLIWQLGGLRVCAPSGYNEYTDTVRGG